jgi:hypothetical protein
MPNTFAYIALFAYPLLAGWLFKRLPLASALIWTLLLGYLFLPERAHVDFPMLPTLDKNSIPSLSAMLFCWLRMRGSNRMRGVLNAANPANARLLAAGSLGAVANAEEPAKSKSRMVGLLIVLLVLGPLMTVYTNREALWFGDRGIRGLEWYDSFSMILSSILAMIPFLLARRHLASKQGLESLLTALATAGGIYSLLVLFEIRMSPQLHNWVYGFHPHSFLQQKRGDGFRAMVFTQHGLQVALFLAVACVSSISLGFLKQRNDAKRWRWLGLWLLVVLILQKSLGALLIVIPMAAMTIFCRPTLRVALAAGVVATILIYPMLRGAGLIPVEAIREFSQSIDAERASSLAYRLVNEDILLSRAEEKPLFGWGGWGRGRVFNERGQDISVTDGLWVIVIGENGWLGYLTTFGLWCLPVFIIARGRSQVKTMLFVPASVATLLTITLVDLMPNAGIPMLSWFLAGALLGWTETYRKQEQPEVAPRIRTLG